MIFSQVIHIPFSDIDEAPSAMRLVKDAAAVPEDHQLAIKLTDIQFDDLDQNASFQQNPARIDASL